jgi:signal transduction histidine kinase
MDVEERERNRFSAELHDGMGPLLSTIKLYFQWLADTTDLDKRKLIIEKGSKSIEMAIQTARELARGLTSQYMKEVGFIPALRNFAEQICDTGALCIKLETNTNNRFSDIIELMLYRISTELIKNTLTHAAASKVQLEILLNEKANQLIFKYSDNGRGFEMQNQAANSPGFGFISIRKRVEIMKGTIRITSAPGKGMQAEIAVMLN